MASLPLTLAVAALSLQGSSPEFGPINEITGARLRAHLEFIAHDLLEGRDTPSRGLDIAAEYLATHLKLAGLKPAGDKGTFFQNIKMVRTNGGTASAKLSGAELKAGEDFSVSDSTVSLPPTGLVFVGHGAYAPSKNLDPYKDVDVKGKLVVAMQGLGPGIRFADLNSGAIPDYKNVFTAAKERGALGVVYITGGSTSPNSITNGMRWMSGGQGRWSMPGLDGENPRAQMPTISLSSAAAEKLLAGEASTLTAIRESSESGNVPKSFALNASKTIELNVEVKKEETFTKNVVAIAEGTDARLKNEYVALGAHYDHVGMRTTGEDKIFNGADDDGSGTVGLLEIALASAKSKTNKRSLLFVWHTGEEKGLWGSEYFVNNPTVPLANIVCQLNLDMIGRSPTPGRTYREPISETNGSHIIGQGRMSSDLERIVMDVNRRLYALRYDNYYDRPNDPQSLYTRSDHYNYAQKGIPVAFWFDGIHEDYHQVSDTADKIDYVKMERVSRTVLATAWGLANAPQRPRIDRKG